MHDRIRHFLRFISVWALLFGALSSSRLTWLRRYYELSRSGRQIEATITAKREHLAIAYSFTLGGQFFENVSRTAISTVPSARDIEVGDRLQAYYLPRNPTINALGEPRELFDEEMYTVCNFAWFSAIGLLLISAKIRIFPRKSYLGISHQKVTAWI
jgi:Protein of unknown function (DUF3592)